MEIKEEYKEYAKTGASLSLALPFVASSRYAMKRSLDKEFPDAPLQVIGTTLAAYGAAMPIFNPDKKKHSALLVGAGVGSLLASYVDVDDLGRYLKKKLQGLGVPYLNLGDIDVHTQDIPPWWGRSKSYKKMAKLLTRFVLEDTYNRQLGQKVPAGYRHPAVIQTTRKILASKKVSVYNPVDVAKAITDWCWENITYVFDPVGAKEDEDTYTHPYLLLQESNTKGFAAGDCDDSAILVASMLMSVGLTPRFLLWAQDPNKPDVYTHITCALYEPNEQWKPFMTHWPYFNIEPTLKPWENSSVGYDFWPQHFRKAVIPVSK